jgi:hypothetical protein
VAAFGCLLVLVMLVFWGGTARPGPAFVTGVATMIGLLAVFVGASWWLLASPLPSGTRVQPSNVTGLRPVVAVTAISSGLIFTTAGLWDEVWHRKYGGFGRDFLWPPHLLLYGSVALISLIAVIGLLAIALRGTGGWRERFRQEPLLGVIALVSSYLVLAAPSDELWHRLYGQDLSAWSLPHVMLVTGIAMVMLTAVPLALWGPRGHGQRFRGFLALLLIAWATTMLVQVGTAEWEGLKRISSGGDAYRSAFWARPEWLYPVVITVIALFSGRFAQVVTRQPLAASSVAVIVLVARFVTLLVMGGSSVNVSFVPHLLILPGMIALDLWHWIRKDRSAIGNLVSAAVLLVVALPVIAQWKIYPRVNEGTVPGMVFWGLLVGLAAGWAGTQLGAWFASLEPEATSSSVASSGRVVLVGLGVAMTVIAFVLITARPPV